MASTRIITVSGIPYLQVVDYKKTKDGKPKIDVVKSFGRDSLENRMKAEQFSSSYDKLKEVTIEQSEQNSTDDILAAGLAIFGIILGATVVAGVINEFTRR